MRRLLSDPSREDVLQYLGHMFPHVPVGWGQSPASDAPAVLVMSWYGDGKCGCDKTMPKGSLTVCGVPCCSYVIGIQPLGIRCPAIIWGLLHGEQYSVRILEAMGRSETGNMYIIQVITTWRTKPTLD